MKNKGYLSGAGMLALAVVFAKVLGALYRVPLANFLGAEGMGYYQFVYPVFALLLTLSSGAVPTAVSIIVSEFCSRGDEAGAKRFFSVALRLCAIVGAVGSILLASLAYPISYLQSKEAFYGYLCISPAVLIVTVISAYRGWFVGHKNLMPSSISQVTEGLVKMGVGVALTYLLLPYGKQFAVCGALTGVTASEAVTLFILGITYKAKDKSYVSVRLSQEKELVKKMRKTAFPLILCGLILPLSQFVDSILTVNLLRWGNQGGTAEYGVWSGIVSPLINLPVMVCISVGIAITPQMVEERENGNLDAVLQKSDTAIKLTFFLGIPFVLFYLFMGGSVLRTLYPNVAGKIAVGEKLLRMNALSVIGLSVFQIYSAILQGLCRIKVPVKIMAFSMTVKTLLSVILTPKMGIIGTAIASVCGNMLAGIIIFVYFSVFTRFEKTLVKNVSLITVCGGIMGAVIFLSTKFLTSTWGMVAVGTVAGITYLFSVFLFRIFSKEEWKAMPLSSVLIKIDNKINGSIT